MRIACTWHTCTHARMYSAPFPNATRTDVKSHNRRQKSNQWISTNYGFFTFCGFSKNRFERWDRQVCDKNASARYARRWTKIPPTRDKRRLSAGAWLRRKDQRRYSPLYKRVVCACQCLRVISFQSNRKQATLHANYGFSCEMFTVWLQLLYWFSH